MNCTNSSMKAINSYYSAVSIKLHRNMYCSTQPDNTVGYVLKFMKFIPKTINME